MRRMFAPVVFFAAAVFLAGCSEINSGIDKAQACLEAPRIIKDLVADVATLTDDPKAMEKALNDSSAQLGQLADKAANTTLKEATDSLATTLGNINVTTVNDAVDAAQKVGTETTAYLQKLAQACS
ncbi:hypothetical protein [Nonomuraea sp. NPDC050310]|uniref:hypothetical protein n=1 Tax=unclassified Nonomuraea TaxID=2593643 RepID=UPI0033F78BFC